MLLQVKLAALLPGCRESGNGEVKVVPYGILQNKGILAPYISGHSGVIPHFRLQVSYSCTVKVKFSLDNAFVYVYYT